VVVAGAVRTLALEMSIHVAFVAALPLGDALGATQAQGAIELFGDDRGALGNRSLSEGSEQAKSRPTARKTHGDGATGTLLVGGTRSHDNRTRERKAETSKKAAGNTQAESKHNARATPEKKKRGKESGGKKASKIPDGRALLYPEERTASTSTPTPMGLEPPSRGQPAANQQSGIWPPAFTGERHMPTP
jgi:hypothetical protein